MTCATKTGSSRTRRRPWCYFFIHFILWVNICVSSHVAKRFPPRGGSLFGKISSRDSDPIINSARRRRRCSLSLSNHRAFPLYFANSVSLSKLQLPAEKRNISWSLSAYVRGDTRSAQRLTPLHTRRSVISLGAGKTFLLPSAKACNVNPLAHTLQPDIRGNKFLFRHCAW